MDDPVPQAASTLPNSLLGWRVATTPESPSASWIARIGLVAGPMIFASSTAILLGAYEQIGPVAGALAFPVFAWEMSLAAYLIAKGFRQPGEITSAYPERVEPLPA